LKGHPEIEAYASRRRARAAASIARITTFIAQRAKHMLFAFATAATVGAVPIIGLVPSAHAEKIWDIGVFDSCMKKAGDRYASD
jgi:hypothetical protein